MSARKLTSLPALAICTALVICSLAEKARAQDITDAVAREVTVFNDLRATLNAPATDAVAREATAFNDLRATLAPPLVDAVARELTAFNDLRATLAAPGLDAVARELTAFNDLRTVLAAPITDAVAREFTVGLNADIMIDVRTVLRFVAGLSAATPADITEFDLVAGTSAGKLDIRDAVRLARKVTGLQP